MTRHLADILYDHQGREIAARQQGESGNASTQLEQSASAVASREFVNSSTDVRTTGNSPAQYECWSCGTFFHPTHENERRWRDRQNGEDMMAHVCDRCISLGWDDWHV